MRGNATSNRLRLPARHTFLTIALAAALLLSVCCSLPAAEPNGGFTVDHFSTDKGLPSSVVLALTQAWDGYLWAGTLAGLARFDGVQFTVFDENNTPGLTSSEIGLLYEDRQTNLWVGTQNGRVAIVKAGKVTSMDLGQGTNAGPLMAVCEDASGAVWLYTDLGVLARYQGGRVQVSRAGPEAHSTCRALVTDDSGHLLTGTDWQLLALNPSTLAPESAQAIRLKFLLPSKRGGYWRLGDGVVQKWNNGRLERDFGAYPWTNTLPIVAACEDLDGNLVVGTYGDGVYWYDAEGKATHISKEQGLSHESVLSVTVDREGCLWVGTNGGGLYRVKRRLFGVLARSSGLVVQSVCEDAQGRLWIGYTGNRVDYYSRTDAGTLEIIPGSFPADVNPAALVDVKSVFAVRKAGAYGGNSVLNGTWGASGPHLYQLEKGQFTLLDLHETPDLQVSAIFQDRAGRVWLGRQGDLLLLDDLRLYTTHEGAASDNVRAIAEDREGNLWIGTKGGGLSRLRDGRFTTFTKANGLPGNSVCAAEVDSQGVLWVATFGGLARFDGTKWTRFTMKEGLASNNLGYLLEDGRGYLWVGSSAGLLRLRKDELNGFVPGKSQPISCRVYGEPDGLPATECTSGSQPGALRGQDGTLWFPTIRGLASLNPARLNLNTNPPPVVIEAVLIDGQLQNPDTLGALPPQTITVPASSETLDIRYASLNLAAPDRGRFKYQLIGHETTPKEWPGNVREVRYTKLPAREYQFHVTACNEDDVWSSLGASLIVKVLPPFWQTWWFLSLTTLCLLGMIVGSVHYVSTQRLQRQLAALRQKEALEKDRARIARDIHDQVGASLTQLSLLGELVESDKNQPEEVAGHARQIEQTALETTHALDEIVWTVNPSNDTLDGLVTYICKYAQDYLAVAGLRYRLETPPQLPGTPISPELRHNVFLASKEAITNVVRHAQATAVSLRLRLDSASFTVEIEDDGRGLGRLDPKAAQTRNGLRNMRKRMEDIGGSFFMGPAPERGTVVSLTAPLKSA